MPATYEPIASTTLGSAGTITFTSIPSTYTDLKVIFIGKSSTGSGCLMTLNNNTSSLYSFTTLQGSGSTASSSRATTQTEFAVFNNNFSTTIPQFATIHIFSYSGSTNKTILIESSYDLNGSGYVERQVGLFRSTSAISSIQFTQTAASGTTATLFGILRA